MPPCAAILWALLGVSWIQKDLTLYPNSANVAAAEPPANPVPTTIILNKNEEEIARIIGSVDFTDEKIVNWLKSKM